MTKTNFLFQPFLKKKTGGTSARRPLLPNDSVAMIETVSKDGEFRFLDIAIGLDSKIAKAINALDVRYLELHRSANKDLTFLLKFSEVKDGCKIKSTKTSLGVKFSLSADQSVFSEATTDTKCCVLASAVWESTDGFILMMGGEKTLKKQIRRKVIERDF